MLFLCIIIMDRVLLQNEVEKEFDAISCVIHNIQICLNCGSKSITLIDNKIKCNNCENIKSKCGVRDLV